MSCGDCIDVAGIFQSNVMGVESFSLFTGRMSSSDGELKVEVQENDIPNLDRPTGLVSMSRNEFVVSSRSEISVLRLGGPEGLSKHTSISSKCDAISKSPHNDSVVVYASDRSLCFWDIRAKSTEMRLKTSHFFPILCLDANPNLENVYATGGADGMIMFWDRRQNSSNTPLETVVNAHSHHVTCIKYHSIHDQILISSGTDCTVNLWRFQNVSANPSNAVSLISPKTGNTPFPVPTKDGIVESYKRHEDSIYRCCWSQEGWAFGSISYDGLVMVNSVPTAEKYRIML